jgi:Txe/YoeB family toxin of Txe-Axe toxin-antitoxin module
MGFEYKSFGGNDSSAFGSAQTERLDYKTLTVNYPSEQDESIDIRILTDPKDDRFNKRLSQHEWLRTIPSFSLDSKDKSTKYDKDNPDAPGKIRYIGTRKCINKSDKDEVCEYCKYIGGRLKEITEILNTIYKSKVPEDAGVNEYKALLKKLTETIKVNKENPAYEKYLQYETLEMEFNNLWGSRCQQNTHMAVYVATKGPRLIKANGALKDKIKSLIEEKKDVTKMWLRVKNNKTKKKKASEWYLVFEVPEDERIGVSEKQLKALEDSDILKLLKSYVEEETPEKQLNNLNGIFKKEEPKVEAKVDENENLTSLEDLDSELKVESGKTDTSSSANSYEDDSADVSDEVDNLFG